MPGSKGTVAPDEMFMYVCPECGTIWREPGLCTMWKKHKLGQIRVEPRRVIFQPAVTPEMVDAVARAMFDYHEELRRSTWRLGNMPDLTEAQIFESLAEQAIKVLL